MELLSSEISTLERFYNFLSLVSLSSHEFFTYKSRFFLLLVSLVGHGLIIEKHFLLNPQAAQAKFKSCA